MGIFRHLQLQVSCELHLTVKIGEKQKIYISIYARTCFSQSTSVSNRDFYTPRLFATPTEATQLCNMTVHAQLCIVNGVCALESSSYFCAEFLKEIW